MCLANLEGGRANRRDVQDAISENAGAILSSIEHTMEEQLTILSKHIIFSHQLVAIGRAADGLGKWVQMYNVFMQTMKPETMKPDDTIINHILDVIARAPGCPINHVPNLFPDLTRKEVFYTVGYLKRKGLLELTVVKQGGVAVTASLRLFN